MMLQVNESDWKLFRKRLPDWQEGHMEGLVRESTLFSWRAQARLPTSFGRWKSGSGKIGSMWVLLPDEPIEYVHESDSTASGGYDHAV